MNALQKSWRLGGALVVAAVWAVPASSPALAQTAQQAQAKPDETAQLRKRVEQLEEQLIDIQVVLGTLETLAKSGVQPSNGNSTAQGAGFASQSGGSDRISALETQVRALTSQVQQLSSGQSPNPTAALNPLPPASTTGQNQTASQAPVPGFGSTIVQPESQGGTGVESSNLAAPSTSPSDTNTGGVFQPSAAQADAQSQYEAAYGLLLQQDYGAAQSSFAEFLKNNPQSPLAGNAQYWLGETFYVRGQYKSAAGAFLKGYRQFSRGNKAPDSLLKLAMSLDKLGQRAAACSSLAELDQKYPQAAAHVRRRASQERSRLRC